MPPALDLGLAVAGIGLFGVHAILSGTRYGFHRTELSWFHTLVESTRRRLVVDAISWVLLSIGLIRAVRGTRSWAHDDDILTLFATTAALIWATTPRVPSTTTYTVAGSEGDQKEDETAKAPWYDMYLFFPLYFLARFCAFFGGFLVLAFLSARGKSHEDRKLAFAGALTAGFGMASGRMSGYRVADQHNIGHAICSLIEIAGWVLFGVGVLSNQIDLDAPQGFNMP